MRFFNGEMTMTARSDLRTPSVLEIAARRESAGSWKEFFDNICIAAFSDLTKRLLESEMTYNIGINETGDRLPYPTVSPSISSQDASRASFRAGGRAVVAAAGAHPEVYGRGGGTVGISIGEAGYLESWLL